MSSQKRREDYMFVKQSGQQLAKRPGDIAGNSFKIADLADCVVHLPDLISTIYVDNCQNCVMYIGPVESSIFVRKSQNCTISVAAQQIRVSFSSDITLNAFSGSNVALEEARGVRLGPYNFVYPQVTDHMRQAELLGKKNQGFSVHDFTPSKELPNWTLLDRGTCVWHYSEGATEESPKPVDWAEDSGEAGDGQAEPEEGEMRSFQIVRSKEEAVRQIQRINEEREQKLNKENLRLNVAEGAKTEEKGQSKGASREAVRVGQQVNWSRHSIVNEAEKGGKGAEGQAGEGEAVPMRTGLYSLMTDTLFSKVGRLLYNGQC